MATNLLRRLAVNDDVEAEFWYWKTQLVHAAWMAIGLAATTGFAIAAWPADSGDPAMRDFARQFWTLLVECAFWLGFLLGLLWAGAKRFGSSLSGTLPWQSASQLGARLAGARRFGQWGACFFLLGVGFWLTRQLALIADANLMTVLASLTPVTQACFGASAVLAAAALLARTPPK